MRIAVLSNHFNALPSLEFLFKTGFLAGVGVSDLKRDACQRIKLAAHEHNIPFDVIPPKNTTEHLKTWLGELRPDAVFVLNFSYKIEASLLAVPRFGFFNFHPGILPQYRGPVPVFWELKNQEKVGGVTAHLMDADFDAGPIVQIERVPFDPEDTFGAHMTKLAYATLQAVRALTEKLVQNASAIKYEEQDVRVARYTSFPNGNDLAVHWNTQDANAIAALVRAANPVFGGAIAIFRGQPLRLLEVAVNLRPAPPRTKPGTIVSAGAAEGITVATCEGKSLRVVVAVANEGCYSGRKLAEIFGIKAGESFAIAP